MGSEADLNRAESLYLEAYRKGVGYAALGLARLYHEAGSPFQCRKGCDVAVAV